METPAVFARHSLRNGLQVSLVAAAPSLDPATRSEIDRIWADEKANRGAALFNGHLVSAGEIRPGHIVAWLAEYRWFVAQRRNAALYPQLQVRPLAVTGLLLCTDGVVFGQRSASVVQDPGLWELAPSGGVDDCFIGQDGVVDLPRQLLTELTEETGIAAEQAVGPLQPFAMLEDLANHVIEIGFVIRTELSGCDIRAIFKDSGSHEYTELEVVPAARVPEFVKRHGSTLVAASRALLEAREEAFR